MSRGGKGEAGPDLPTVATIWPHFPRASPVRIPQAHFMWWASSIDGGHLPPLNDGVLLCGPRQMVIEASLGRLCAPVVWCM
jgi:hypothetical protein